MGRKGGGDGFFLFSSGRDVTPAAERRPKRSEGSAKGAINQLGGKRGRGQGWLAPLLTWLFFRKSADKSVAEAKKYHEGEKVKCRDCASDFSYLYIRRYTYDIHDLSFCPTIIASLAGR